MYQVSTIVISFDILAPLYYPSNWTCDPYDYNDGSVCNCECGTVDPDCYIPDNTVFLYNQVIFTETGYWLCKFFLYLHFWEWRMCWYRCLFFCFRNFVAFPSSCNRSTFGTKDGCQCGNLSCALPDPDCSFLATFLM